MTVPPEREQEIRDKFAKVGSSGEDWRWFTTGNVRDLLALLDEARRERDEENAEALRTVARLTRLGDALADALEGLWMPDTPPTPAALALAAWRDRDKGES